MSLRLSSGYLSAVWQWENKFCWYPFLLYQGTWIWKESQFWTLLQFSSILNTSKQNHKSISPFLAALLFKTLSSNFPVTTSHVKLRNNDFFEIIPAGFYVCGPLSSLFVGFTSANISNSTMHPNLGFLVLIYSAQHCSPARRHLFYKILHTQLLRLLYCICYKTNSSYLLPYHFSFPKDVPLPSPNLILWTDLSLYNFYRPPSDTSIVVLILIYSPSKTFNHTFTSKCQMSLVSKEIFSYFAILASFTKT